MAKSILLGQKTVMEWYDELMRATSEVELSSLYLKYLLGKIDEGPASKILNELLAAPKMKPLKKNLCLLSKKDRMDSKVVAETWNFLKIHSLEIFKSIETILGIFGSHRSFPKKIATANFEKWYGAFFVWLSRGQFDRDVDDQRDYSEEAKTKVSVLRISKDSPKIILIREDILKVNKIQKKVNAFMIGIDAPYGVPTVGNPSWNDSAWTREQWKLIIMNAMGMTSSDAYVLIILCNFRQLGLVSELLEELGFKGVIPHVIYKRWKEPEDLHRLTNVVEMGVWAYYGDSKTLPWNYPHGDNRCTHNISVVDRAPDWVIDTDGKAYNPCQQAPESFYRFAKAHQREGSYIIDLCAGVGGFLTEIAIMLRIPLVAVEQDQRCFKGLQKNVSAIIAAIQSGTPPPCDGKGTILTITRLCARGWKW